jgi:hypothetical protein
MPDSMRLARSLAGVVLLGSLLRLAVSVAAGITEWAQSGGHGYPDAVTTAGAVLTLAGSSGDGVEVLLGLAALALVWWLLAAGERVESLRSVTAVVLALTAVSAFVSALGALLLYAIGPDSSGFWPQTILQVGQGLVYAILALGGLAAARATAPLMRTQPAERFGDDDPFLFAVDRTSGEVHAYLSVDEAERKSHVFSIEDDEFAFYTDEGTVVRASVERDRVRLEPTDVEQRDVLLERLGEFVVRRGIHVHEQDAVEPVAYARPIRDWQWLQLWPGWLRWLGRIVRPR